MIRYQRIRSWICILEVMIIFVIEMNCKTKTNEYGVY